MNRKQFIQKSLLTQKWIILCLALILTSCSQKQKVVILIDAKASNSLQFAASELRDKLGAIYPDTPFIIRSSQPARGYTIHVLPGNGKHRAVEGAFSISHNAKEAWIAGHDEFGVLQGVYGILEQLGYDFHLSHDILLLQPEPFNLDDWELTDFPLQKERLVFNWHNFLSGCTGWDLEHWKQWILQSAKLGFSTIMIHTYGNNPIHTFNHNGIPKPVGYLACSVNGRDWGTEHVNDVRKLIGGELFSKAVFGSSAALVEDSLRTEAAKALMKDVFSYADLVGMKINFAFDIDTRSANPQEILHTLPEHARIITKDGFSLANPETEEGYGFYRSQILGLLQAYPQIDRLVGWTRKYNPNPQWLTPVRSLTPREFPPAWQSEYSELIEQNPAMGMDIYAPSTFVLGKILRAYSRILAESGMKTALGSGSWEFGFLPTASYFYSEDITLYPLDFKVLFNSDSVRSQLQSVGSERSLIPILWAHHDDHRYMGKPYTPFESLQDKLEESGASGFGIIHWLTRPLDIYFKSLSRQVWNNTKNEDIRSLNSYISGKIFTQGQQIFEEYLNDWILNAPMFGRETSDHFMDPGSYIIGEFPSNPDSLLHSITHRIGLLKKLSSEDLNPGARKQVDYYLGLEYFYKSFILQHTILYKSNLAWMEGQHIEASRLISGARPEQTIEAFSKQFLNTEASKGELAMIISMNLRWYPDFVNQKQLARLEPILYNFQPTQHDILAQAPGTFSFFIDEHGTFRRGLGEAEIGTAKAFMLNSESSETRDQWISAQKAFTLSIQTWRGQVLSPGKYKAILNFRGSIASLVSFQINGQGEVTYSLFEDPESPYVEFEFTSNGEAIDLQIDPLGTEIKLTSLEIIPLK